MEWAVPNFPLLSLCSRIGDNTFFVAASQVTEMLQGNIIAPYNIKSKVRDKSRPHPLQVIVSSTEDGVVKS